MMRKILYIIALLTGLSASAQSVIRTQSDWEFELKAGLNIVGGAAPAFMPVELRSIDGYAPKYGMALEGVAIKWFGEKYGLPEWGLSLGLRVESRGMRSDATVKSFKTKVYESNNTIEGYFTGKVSMEYRSNTVSLPILLNYRFNEDWKVRGGIYLGYEMDGKFTTKISNGYLRTPTPVGEKLAFDKPTPYDFSDQLRKLHWGGQIGGSWRAYKHFQVNADLNVGFNNIFKSSFEGIAFNLFPIFLQVGFGYQF